jgi:hypothetical protein
MCRGTNSSSRALLFQRQGPFRLIWPRLYLEAPEADENQDGDDAKESEEDTSSSTSPPPVLAEDIDTGVDKKRKRVDEFASSSSATADKASVLVGDMEYFDLLAS